MIQNHQNPLAEVYNAQELRMNQYGRNMLVNGDKIVDVENQNSLFNIIGSVYDGNQENIAENSDPNSIPNLDENGKPKSGWRNLTEMLSKDNAFQILVFSAFLATFLGSKLIRNFQSNDFNDFSDTDVIIDADGNKVFSDEERKAIARTHRLEQLFIDLLIGYTKREDLLKAAGEIYEKSESEMAEYLVDSPAFRALCAANNKDADAILERVERQNDFQRKRMVSELFEYFDFKVDRLTQRLFNQSWEIVFRRPLIKYLHLAKNVGLDKKKLHEISISVIDPEDYGADSENIPRDVNGKPLSPLHAMEEKVLEKVQGKEHELLKLGKKLWRGFTGERVPMVVDLFEKQIEDRIKNEIQKELSTLKSMDYGNNDDNMPRIRDNYSGFASGNTKNSNRNHRSKVRAESGLDKIDKRFMIAGEMGGDDEDIKSAEIRELKKQTAVLQKRLEEKERIERGLKRKNSVNDEAATEDEPDAENDPKNQDGQNEENAASKKENSGLADVFEAFDHADENANESNSRNSYNLVNRVDYNEHDQESIENNNAGLSEDEDGDDQDQNMRPVDRFASELKDLLDSR